MKKSLPVLVFLWRRFKYSVSSDDRSSKQVSLLLLCEICSFIYHIYVIVCYKGRCFDGKKCTFEIRGSTLFNLKEVSYTKRVTNSTVY